MQWLALLGSIFGLRWINQLIRQSLVILEWWSHWARTLDALGDSGGWSAQVWLLSTQATSLTLSTLCQSKRILCLCQRALGSWRQLWAQTTLTWRWNHILGLESQYLLLEEQLLVLGLDALYTTRENAVLLYLLVEHDRNLINLRQNCNVSVKDKKIRKCNYFQTTFQIWLTEIIKFPRSSKHFKRSKISENYLPCPRDLCFASWGSPQALASLGTRPSSWVCTFWQTCGFGVI